MPHIKQLFYFPPKHTCHLIPAMPLVSFYTPCFIIPVFPETATKRVLKKSVLKNFANFFKFQFKKETKTLVFSCEIYEIFKNTNFEEHLRTTVSFLH